MFIKRAFGYPKPLAGLFFDKLLSAVKTCAIALASSDTPGRPPLRPRARPDFKPAWPRSRIKSRSDSANGPNI